MKHDGLDALIANFEDMLSDIDDDVDEILKNNAIEYSTDAKKTAKEVMNKGYWTGNLAGNIKQNKSGHLEYTIVSNAHYSGFLEYGTRYMEAAPFMHPVYLQIQKSVKQDLERLLND